MVLARRREEPALSQRSRHYLGYTWTIWKLESTDEEGRRTLNLLEPDKWTSSADPEPIFAQGTPRGRSTWSRVTFWLYRKSIASGETLPEGGEDVAERQWDMVNAYLKKASAHDAAFAADMRKSFGQFERYQAAFECFVLQVFGVYDSSEPPRLIDDETKQHADVWTIMQMNNGRLDKWTTPWSIEALTMWYRYLCEPVGDILIPADPSKRIREVKARGCQVPPPIPSLCLPARPHNLA